MSSDDDNEKPNLPPLPSDYPSAELLLADLSERVNQLTTAVLKLEASRADNVLELASAVAKQNTTRDRLTDAVLENTHKNTELFEQRDFFVNASNAIHASIREIQTALSIRKTVKNAVREATDKHRRLSHDELEGKIGAATRFVEAIEKTSTSAKLLLAFLAGLLFFTFGGWFFLKVHKDTEEPQGRPIERRAEEPKALPPKAEETKALPPHQ